MDIDIALMARKLALKHVAGDADRGISEATIQSSHHGSSCGELFVKNTGGDEFGSYDVSIGGYVNGRNVPPTKVVVHRVCGITVDKIYSLHELYQECRKGQLSLI